ncbi:free methionine-(R)-sulfoxide reductase containing GAF domain [Pseudoalteromonas sp. SW0106-04]|uniref:GAF domain-containing protein n=1 Tax=Pseudoalteromonas sp. SW0106-04 TaxID=1702169 RepID=UPI0006B5A3D2|nr:GAF domain-containing protein [Pseudoalteromonas sp. SW0106-04]GAP76435.1 free methionine-(R)-sulfoxide reductase containing GAF domain [Pseudoalteromonas sp. SW0106-04]
MSKEAFYESLTQQALALVSDETNQIANMANISALLFMSLEDINWAGFYILESPQQMVLGPFQGKPACVRIEVGKGVCGTAVAEDTTQLVTDVHQFPGHIACDAASNSEVVVVVKKQGNAIAVLDIDSPTVGRFDEQDKQGLEKLVHSIEQYL